MRCIAHILNMVVSEGLKESNSSVRKVREIVRYIRNSPLRLSKFKDACDLVGIESKASLTLDVTTRWNATYLMLFSACIFEKAFEKYDEQESSFRKDLGDAVPNSKDWDSVKQLVVILEKFYRMTLRISRCLYVTSNSFFHEISDLCCLLKDMTVSKDLILRDMGLNMKCKFDKYWGDPLKMNNLIFIANIFNPIDRVEYMEFTLIEIYGTGIGGNLYRSVISDLHELFDDYMMVYTPRTDFNSRSNFSVETISQSSVVSSQPMSMLKAKFKQQKFETGLVGSKKSELELYLNEAIVEEEGDFDILRWWKLNSERLPILSRLARDVVAIPVSTVASESAFSTSGRVLDAFRSSLTPKIVEALVCCQDWLRDSNKPIQIEEILGEMEDFEQGLAAVGNGPAIQQ
ncbi:zinc finger BED domain-containing protein RICESLEEPER 2-like [Mercurialis annua]|uniref:zinc finger BED domain-containing protein RICESLEEPER 2-like n=1 Tax=Mercurialis annua TaxID=3986 RepID=UPI0021600E27|nr:zinc finger BED domain-containing protein RICESLEEPER 2-like [Mercurialis annua]